MLAGIFLIMMVVLFGLVLGVGGTILWIWAIVHCIQNRRLSDGEKALWVILIIFTHFIGAVIYFAVGRSSNRMIPYYTSQQPYTNQQPYAGQQQPYQQPYAAPGQQQPYQYPYAGSGQQPNQYYQPPMPMYQAQQGHYSETPQASYPEQSPPEQ